MKMFIFEWRKLIRSSGFKSLCIGILVINFLLIFFADISESNPQKQQEHISNYNANISYTVRVAERNRIDYEYTSGDDSYIVKYQEDIIEIYSSLLEAGNSPEESSGWNEYFSYKADDFCLLLFAVTVGIILSVTEHDNRTDTLQKITRFGKKSIRRKIAVFAISSLGFAVIVTLLTLLGFGIRFELSSPFVPLCSVIKFLYCPYNVSVFEYLLISLLVKTLNMFSLMLLSAWISNLSKSYIASVFVSVCTIAAGFGISQIPANSGWLYINSYSLGISDAAFERYRSVNIFGYSVSVSIIIALFLFTVCALLCALLFADNRRYKETSVFANFEKSVKRLVSKAKEKSGVLYARASKRKSLFVCEAKKSFIKSRLIILCAIMICIKLYYTESNLPQASSYEPYYRSICNEIAGELTEDKRAVIQNKLSQSKEIIAQHEKMRNDFNNGAVTYEEYSAYREKLDLAFADEFAYGKLYEQCLRIDRANANGIKAQLLYDTGWRCLFEVGADIILYAFLLLFFCGIYSMEYNNGFDKIAHTTACGMKALHKAKVKLAVTVAFVAFLIFFGTDLFYLVRLYPLANAGFPLASVIEDASSVPLWSAMLLFVGIKLALAVALSVLICQLSRFLKKTYLSFSAGILVTALLFGMNIY